MFATADGSDPLKINRLTSDGALAEFKKDGTTVGSIGVVGSDILYIGTSDGSDAGLNFDGDNSRINPCNGTGAATDNALDLGQSGARFKDLYLSGTAYIDTAVGIGVTPETDWYSNYKVLQINTAGALLASYASGTVLEPLYQPTREQLAIRSLTATSTSQARRLSYTYKTTAAIIFGTPRL